MIEIDVFQLSGLFTQRFHPTSPMIRPRVGWNPASNSEGGRRSEGGGAQGPIRVFGAGGALYRGRLNMLSSISSSNWRAVPPAAAPTLSACPSHWGVLEVDEFPKESIPEPTRDEHKRRTTSTSCNRWMAPFSDRR